MELGLRRTSSPRKFGRARLQNASGYAAWPSRGASRKQIDCAVLFSNPAARRDGRARIATRSVAGGSDGVVEYWTRCLSRLWLLPPALTAQAVHTLGEAAFVQEAFCQARELAIEERAGDCD